MVMRQMRENTKWIMLATVVAFALLMVFEWGMDMTGRSSGSMGELGRVNGTPIQYEDYITAYRSLYDQVQNSQPAPISNAQNRELEDAAWNQLVDRILIRQELERRGIGVSEEEIRQAARFNPPPEMRGSPAFLTDGAFDLQKYQDYLATSGDPVLFQQLEAYYRDVLPQGKLMRQLATGVYLTDGELWRRYREATEQATVRFVALDPTVRIPNDSVTVTDREIRDYWDDHQEDFEVPAQATVKVVVLPRPISPADSAAARSRVEALLEEVRGGAPFDTVGAREAQATEPVTFEDLGTFGRGQMVAPFDSAAFAAPVGRPVGPILTPFGYHVLLASARTADSVTAKHILVPITRTEDSEIRLLELADSLDNLLENRSIEEAALGLGMLDVQTVELSEAFPFVTGAGQVTDGADWAIEEAEPGDVSEVFENDQAYYAMELVSSRPGGVLPLEEASQTIRQMLQQRKKIEKAEAEAQRLVERIGSGTTLSQVAAEEGLAVREPAPFSRQQFVAGLGQMNAAIGASFGLQPGEVSAPVATSENVFLIEKLAETPADSSAWLAQREQQREQLTMLVVQQRVQEWLDGLREAARISDRREEVLQPADADAPLNPYMPF